MRALPTHVDTRSETDRANREGFLVAASLRSDPQAKSLGEYLRAKHVPIPISLLEPN